MSVYALGDLHGRLDILREVQKIIGEDDKVFFLGDAGDRGPDPWETIKAIIDDERFVYLMGNHEDMLIDAYISQKKKGEPEIWFDQATQHLQKNDGLDTLQQALDDPKGGAYINILRNLPYWDMYQNECGIVCLLSHAGWTMSNYSSPSEFDLIWDRSHFWDPWDENNYPHVVSIHGHTPIPHMWVQFATPQGEQETGAFWYCDNHKICIDSGAYATDIAILLNLDTFDEIIVEVPSDKEYN